MKAQSTSSDNMSQKKFDKVYSDVATVLLENILSNYTRGDLDNHVNHLMEYQQ